jgi:hypothetical protein
MRTTLYSLLIAIMAMPLGCRPVKKALKQGLITNDPIQIAILDFSKTCRLYRQDSVFHVSITDTVWRLALKQYSNREYKWVNDYKYDDITAISILGTNNQFLLTAKVKIGGTHQIPSRFIEKNGKLFYWYDDNYPLTAEVIAVFKKYHLFQDDQGGLIQFAQKVTDDSKKGIDYYFCRSDPTIYKKVISNKPLGYYDAPLLKCNGY